ncbi:hypothetical protein D3C77_312630 [compost metagenome]
MVLELDCRQELKARLFDITLVEINHAQVIANFLVGRRQAHGPQKMALGLEVVAASRRQLAQAMLSLGSQTATEQAAVQRFGLAAPKQA